MTEGESHSQGVPKSAARSSAALGFASQNTSARKSRDFCPAVVELEDLLAEAYILDSPYRRALAQFTGSVEVAKTLVGGEGT